MFNLVTLRPEVHPIMAVVMMLSWPGDQCDTLQSSVYLVSGHSGQVSPLQISRIREIITQYCAMCSTQHTRLSISILCNVQHTGKCGNQINMDLHQDSDWNCSSWSHNSAQCAAVQRWRDKKETAICWGDHWREMLSQISPHSCVTSTQLGCYLPLASVTCHKPAIWSQGGSLSWDQPVPWTFGCQLVSAVPPQLCLPDQICCGHSCCKMTW